MAFGFFLYIGTIFSFIQLLQLLQMADVKTVLVTNISAALDQTHLQELFGCCGPISKCKLEKLPDGEQICRITYTDPAHARAATVLNDTPLGDKKLRVTLDVPVAAAPSVPAPAVTATPLLATPAAPLLGMPSLGASASASAPPDILAAVAAAAAAIPVPGTAPAASPAAAVPASSDSDGAVATAADPTAQVSLPVYLPGTSTASTLMPSLPAHMLSQAQKRAEEVTSSHLRSRRMPVSLRLRVVFSLPINALLLLLLCVL